MDINATTATSSVIGSYLFSSMVIFHDPMYIIVAGLGGAISLFLARYELEIERAELKDDFSKSIVLASVRAFILGFIFSLFIFVGLILHNQDLLKMINPEYDGIMKIAPSLSIGVTLVLSTYAIKFWDFSTRRLKK